MVAIKRYVALASIALSLVLLGYVLYPALSSFTGPLTDLPFYVGAPQPYSYIIDTNGTHYFAFNGTTGYNEVTTDNASEVFETVNTAINASGHDGEVYIKSGIYDIANDYILFQNWDDGPSISYIGETKTSATQGVIFQGNGSEMIHSQGWNTTGDEAWEIGGWHQLKNLKFEHTTPNANAVTLNLTHIVYELDNLYLLNENTTRQGTAIYTLHGDGLQQLGGANPGHPLTWKDVNVLKYGCGMNVSIDHLAIINPHLYNNNEYALFWHNSAWSSIYNLQISAESDTTFNPLYLRHLGHGCTIFDMNIEEAGTLSAGYSIITVDDGWYPVQIYGFFSTLNTASNFWNRTDTGGTAELYVYISAHSGNFLSDCGALAVVANGEWVPHLLFNAPYYVQVTVESDLMYSNEPVLVGVNNKNATKFQVSVYWANGTAITDDTIDIYWYASVNRK